MGLVRRPELLRDELVYFTVHPLGGAVGGPEAGLVARPARNDMEVQMPDALPRVRPTRVEHHNPGRTERILHRKPHALNELHRQAKQGSRRVQHANVMSSRHHQGVPRCQGVGIKRKERDDLGILRDPASVARNGIELHPVTYIHLH